MTIQMSTRPEGFFNFGENPVRSFSLAYVAHVTGSSPARTQRGS